MRDELLIFGSPAIENDELDEVRQVLESGWLGTGPRVHQFENDFASYVDMPHAVALNSCTAALHLSILAAGLKPGDEVITTPLTFCASANAILHAGATPVLADIDPVTMNIDPERIVERITPQSRAIMPVHFSGRPCDMDAIMAIAREHDLKVIEDCAHAIETTYHGQHAGTFGDFGCFSFYVTKNVVTGEGGMIVTRDAASAGKIKILGLHGMSKDAWKRFGDDGYKHYQVVECGFKYNMMDLQAAIGIHQLTRVERYWLRRHEIWQRYDDAFSQMPVEIPAPVEADTRHGYHLYTLLIDEARCGVSRDAFLEKMKQRNIGLGVHYLSLPEHEYYQKNLAWQADDWPHAKRVGRQTVSLPLSAKLTDGDVQDVIDAVSDVLA